MRRLLLLFLFLFYIAYLQAQNTQIKGVVYGNNQDGEMELLVGANIMWLNSLIGTTTDGQGRFEIDRVEKDSLRVSFIGYQPATLFVGNDEELKIVLQSTIMLAATEIIHHQKSTIISHSAILQSENLGHGELNKAACCNLSESFETSPTVDVSFTDAISGAKQIRMLGLAGPYSQITRENMPDIRGLSSVNGMEFIPGTWINGIQLIKGAGSVVNGYESIAGQINTELQRAETMPDLFVNLYANIDRQYEANIQFKLPFGKHWQNAVFLHGKYGDYMSDMNKDGFADKPSIGRLIAMDRLEWVNDKNIHLEFGFRLIYQDQTGGTIANDSAQIGGVLSSWKMTSTVRKADFWTKIGRISELKPWNSTAVQISANIYFQEAAYGQSVYSGDEKSLYINAIQQGQLFNKKHEFKIGMSLLYDDFIEKFNNSLFLRSEIVPGVFGEYIFKPVTQFTLVGGLRADFHNQFGLFLTPRLHGRWAIFEKTILRFSAGRGFRNANIFSEHLSMLASNRQVVIHTNQSNYGYGLNPEIAWNYGLNLTHSFELDYREFVIGASFYRTDFVNQIVFDIDRDFREVHFYNLDGQSFANSLQVQIDYELIKRLDIRLAYRFYDVQTTYDNKLLENPLIGKQRGFLNLAYKTRNHWEFDATFNWVGQKRIPINILSPTLSGYSPDYMLINAQILKTFSEKIVFYVGVENLTNFRQENPILNAENPYAQGFDASLIWGPIWGQHFYLGLKIKVEKLFFH